MPKFPLNPVQRRALQDVIEKRSRLEAAKSDYKTALEAAAAAGCSYRVIGAAAGLSHSRVHKIVTGGNGNAS